MISLLILVLRGWRSAKPSLSIDCFLRLPVLLIRSTVIVEALLGIGSGALVEGMPGIKVPWYKGPRVPLFSSHCRLQVWGILRQRLFNYPRRIVIWYIRIAKGYITFPKFLWIPSPLLELSQHSLQPRWVFRNFWQIPTLTLGPRSAIRGFLGIPAAPFMYKCTSGILPIWYWLPDLLRGLVCYKFCRCEVVTSVEYVIY